jgi:hypothetical protein
MARALVDKLEKFLSTFAGFERAFLSARVRQTDFEVVKLSHNSPTEMGLNPVPRTANYTPGPLVKWTLDQWDRICQGERPDKIIGEDLVADVIELATKPDAYSYSTFLVRHAGQSIRLDEDAVRHAQALKAQMRTEVPALPWRNGVSHGVVRGALQSALDANGERMFIICPFVGPKQIKCSFPESMRADVKKHLWGTVTVSGLMHYGETGPHPYLIEIDAIDGLTMADDAPHFLSAAGMFRSASYSPTASIQF